MTQQGGNPRTFQGHHHRWTTGGVGPSLCLRPLTRAPRRTREFALPETSPAGCPFCDRDLAAANDLAVAFRDAYPVNLGHILIIPRRHVPTWFEATREEQLGILELADQIKG